MKNLLIKNINEKIKNIKQNDTAFIIRLCNQNGIDYIAFRNYSMEEEYALEVTGIEPRDVCSILFNTILENYPDSEKDLLKSINATFFQEQNYDYCLTSSNGSLLHVYDDNKVYEAFFKELEEKASELIFKDKVTNYLKKHYNSLYGIIIRLNGPTSGIMISSTDETISYIHAIGVSDENMAKILYDVVINDINPDAKLKFMMENTEFPSLSIEVNYNIMIYIDNQNGLYTDWIKELYSKAKETPITKKKRID